jgi:hypothetical protein
MVKKRSLKKNRNQKMIREEKRKKSLIKKQKYYNSKKQKICNAHKTRKDCHHWINVKTNPNQYKAQCVWLRNLLTPWKSSCRDENNGWREKHSFDDIGEPRFKT